MARQIEIDRAARQGRVVGSALFLVSRIVLPSGSKLDDPIFFGGLLLIHNAVLLREVDCSGPGVVGASRAAHPCRCICTRAAVWRPD